MKEKSDRPYKELFRPDSREGIDWEKPDGEEISIISNREAEKDSRQNGLVYSFLEFREGAEESRQRWEEDRSLVASPIRPTRTIKPCFLKAGEIGRGIR